MKKANYLIIILISIISCDSISEEELKSGLDKNLEIYCSALKNFEIDILINYFPPSLIESMGGEKFFETELEKQKKQFFDNGFLYKKITYSSPTKFKQSGNIIHSIVPTQTVIYTYENILTSNAFLYCFSGNYGDNWIIMDYETLKQIYSDFKFEFHPDYDSETIQDSCKYLRFDVFGNDVCVDRFIDSGQYEAESYEGTNVYKLTRKDKSVKLNEGQLILIKKAVESWRNNVGAKYQFPEITKDNIVYIESDIERYCLYDIYGVPFSYISSGKIINDTLPGYFKLERAASYKTAENLEQLKGEKDEFEVLYEVSGY